MTTLERALYATAAVIVILGMFDIVGRLGKILEELKGRK